MGSTTSLESVLEMHIERLGPGSSNLETLSLGCRAYVFSQSLSDGDGQENCWQVTFALSNDLVHWALGSVPTDRRDHGWPPTDVHGFGTSTQATHGMALS